MGETQQTQQQQQRQEEMPREDGGAVTPSAEGSSSSTATGTPKTPMAHQRRLQPPPIIVANKQTQGTAAAPIRHSKPGSVRRHRKGRKVIDPTLGIEDTTLLTTFEEMGAEFVPLDHEGFKTAVSRLVRSFTTKRGQDREGFFIVDLSSAARQVLRWLQCLPSVRPYYAVKCNPNIGILRVMDACNTGFDCASMEEIDTIARLFREEKLKDLRRCGVELLSTHEMQRRRQELGAAFPELTPSTPHAEGQFAALSTGATVQHNNHVHKNLEVAQCIPVPESPLPFGGYMSRDIPIPIQPTTATQATTGGGAAAAGAGGLPAVRYMSTDNFEMELREEMAERVIFANPCKQVTHIRHARSVGVRMTTVDSVFEVDKLAEHWPDAQVVIRIRTDDKNSVMQFSSKFGCTLRESREIIRACKEHGGLQLIGVSFHVGSGCKDAKQYVSALQDARKVFDWARDLAGAEMRLVDIGGGWPGSESSGTPSFEDMCKVVQPAIDSMFPANRYVRIGEPGRFMVTRSHTLCVNVYSKRDCRPRKDAMDVVLSPEQRRFEEEQEKMVGNSMDPMLYYINDGVYGSLNNVIFDHFQPQIHTLKSKEEKKKKYKSTIFGQTCDSMDVIVHHHLLPELNVGDWIFVTDMGAYTLASASTFNGFKLSEVRYIWRN